MAGGFVLNGVAKMTSQRFLCACLLGVFSPFASVIFAAELPTVAETMRIHPKQKDVEYETPKESEYSKCKVEVEKKGKSIGLVVVGPSGQILRKYLDTDGDGQYDQYRFYNLGIEVYRDIDTNKNNKIDQYRWLNRGGSRWGIDKDEDQHIDQWKILSAAEASREAIRAMVTQDAHALQAVMVTADDLKQLGMNSQLATKLLESVNECDKKAKSIMKTSKVFSPQSVWSRFEAQLPSIIPVEDDKAKEDVQIYESAYAIIETPQKNGTKKPDAVQIGEMIRIGEVWKLTQVPMPMEGESITTNPILMEPVLAAADGNQPSPSPKVQKVLTDLQEIEQQVYQPNQTEKQVKALMAKRAALFKEALELAETTEEKESLMRQNIDVLAITAQAGTYPDGAKELKAIETEIAKKTPESKLLPYIVYRRVQADYSVNLDDARQGGGDKQKQAQILKSWLQELEEFVTKFPASDDADDALINLANQAEFQGQPKEAGAWYQKLIKDYPKSKQVARAQGALRRLNLDGQPLSLEGPLLTGGTVSAKDLKDKVYLVVFWNSGFVTSEEDIPQLRALYRDNKKNGFEIIGVALESNKAVAIDYVKKHEMSWPQIFQQGTQNQVGGIDSPLAVQFGIISFPTMFLVNKEGKVVSRNASMTEIKTELPGLLNPKKKN
jgi:thiol-disulfide isomerase/thioredoxin